MTTCKRCKITHWRSGECRAIPQATICNPPEPTVIEASDLASGMVVVVVEDWTFGHSAIVSPDVVFHHDGVATATYWCNLKHATGDDVRYVAGRGRL